MVDVTNDTSRIDNNVEVVSNYLKKEFENFTIAYQADRPRTHTLPLPSITGRNSLS